MARAEEQSILQKLFSLGEDRMNKLLEELLSNPRFAEALGKTVQAALETKGRVDRNMQTVLSLLNLPSKSDYKKLATKIEALQGSMVNLSIKLDRILAAQKNGESPAPKAAKAPSRPRPIKEPKPGDPIEN
jgi:hypothetical protein